MSIEIVCFGRRIIHLESLCHCPHARADQHLALDALNLNSPLVENSVLASSVGSIQIRIEILAFRHWNDNVALDKIVRRFYWGLTDVADEGLTAKRWRLKELYCNFNE